MEINDKVSKNLSIWYADRKEIQIKTNEIKLIGGKIFNIKKYLMDEDVLSEQKKK